VTPTELAEVWTAAVERQFGAARSIDPEALREATEIRERAQEAVAAVLAGKDPDARRVFAEAAPRIRMLDLRIQACGETVLAALGRLLPAPPPATYTRHARYRGNS
jgi:hypothetical protein